MGINYFGFDYQRKKWEKIPKKEVIKGL